MIVCLQLNMVDKYHICLQEKILNEKLFTYSTLVYKLYILKYFRELLLLASTFNLLFEYISLCCTSEQNRMYPLYPIYSNLKRVIVKGINQ